MVHSLAEWNCRRQRASCVVSLLCPRPFLRRLPKKFSNWLNNCLTNNVEEWNKSLPQTKTGNNSNDKLLCLVLSHKRLDQKSSPFTYEIFIVRGRIASGIFTKNSFHICNKCDPLLFHMKYERNWENSR